MEQDQNKTTREALAYFISEISKLQNQYPKMLTKDVVTALSNILQNTK